MLYTGDDILAAVLKPWAIKLFAPHELLELEAQNGIIWQINFDFYEDRVEFLVKCAFLRAEVVRPKRSLAVGGRNMEVDILERQITELKNDLVVSLEMSELNKKRNFLWYINKANKRFSLGDFKQFIKIKICFQRLFIARELQPTKPDFLICSSFPVRLKGDDPEAKNYRGERRASECWEIST